MRWILLVLVFGTLAVLARGVLFRSPSATFTPRRGRRLIGLFLMALSAAAIFGGQAYDLAQLGAVEADPEVEFLTGAAADPAAARTFHVRFVLLALVELDRPTVVAHAIGEVSVGGGEVALSPTWTGAEARGDLRFRARVDRAHDDWFSVSHGYDHENGSASSATSIGSDQGHQLFSIGTMYVERRRSLFRAFDGRRTDLVYAVDMRPLGDGAAVARARYSELWSAGEGKRVRHAFAQHHFGGTTMQAGINAVMTRISGFAFLSIVVGFFGAAFALRRPGFGVALWTLVAPLILIYADRMAIDTFERVIAEDERPAIRAAALRGLDDTVFFVATARERIAALKGDEDPGIARLASTIQVMDRAFGPDIERIDVGPDELMRALRAK